MRLVIRVAIVTATVGIIFINTQTGAAFLNSVIELNEGRIICCDVTGPAITNDMAIPRQ